MENARETALVIYPKDVKVFRNIGPKAVRRPRTKKQAESRRGRVRQLSERSRRQMTFCLKNGGPWQFIATINYGSIAPTDGIEVKKHLDSLLTWITRRKISLLWKMEFSLSGRPHFHLVLTDRLAHRDLQTHWAGVIGDKPTRHLVRVEGIREPDSIPWYLSKEKGDPQNWVPPEFDNVGRFWGWRGPDAKPKALAMIEAAESEIAPVIRIAKKIAEQKKRRQVKDKGLVSTRIYDAGGESVAQAITRHAEALGIRPKEDDGTPRRRKLGSGCKEPSLIENCAKVRIHALNPTKGQESGVFPI